MSEATTPSKGPNTALLAGGGIALVGLGLAAGMFLRSPSSNEAAAPQAASAASAASVASAASSATAPAPTAPQATNDAPARNEPVKAARRHDAERHRNADAGQPVAQPVRQVCGTCGTVDNVRAVSVAGEGSGVGAVAGGVIGGVLGNQMGKGSGKTAMTVLGAIGGGVAGNEIEKRQRAETVYEVTVRMDDGSYRTVTQKTAPATGSRVEVEGDSVRPSNR